MYVLGTLPDDEFPTTMVSTLTSVTASITVLFCRLVIAFTIVFAAFCIRLLSCSSRCGTKDCKEGKGKNKRLLQSPNPGNLLFKSSYISVEFARLSYLTVVTNSILKVYCSNSMAGSIQTAGSALDSVGNTPTC